MTKAKVGAVGKWSGRAVISTALASLLLACATPPEPRQPVAPAQTAEPEAPKPAPVELPPPVQSSLPQAPASVPPPPESCRPLLDNSAAAEAAPACDPAAALDRLDAALAQAEELARDQQLAALEGCSNFPAGWVRALRAELASAECADALAAPLLERAADIRTQRQTARALGAEASLSEKPGDRVADMPADIEQALVGLAVGARLRRLHAPPPAAPSEGTKDQFMAYFKSQLEPWVMQRAKAVHELSMQGSGLRGYGRGVAAVEAAVADLAFVTAAREVPLPKEMDGDEAVRDAYYSALDQALEPRKTRGRDAALVGLADFANIGVLHSPRIQRARSILSKSYAGHRIDALDGLRLPPLPELPTETLVQRLAARIPTFYAQHVLGNLDVTDPSNLRALHEQGLYPKVRGQLDAAALSYDAARQYARSLLALGQRYWRSGDFARAAEVAAVEPAKGQKVAAENKLLQGLAKAFEGGPRTAAQMMLGGPLLPEGVGNVQLLDQLSKERSEVGAMAAYDAAYILALLPPQSDVKKFWRGIAQRYELAARVTKDKDFKSDAQSRAKAARETARQVVEK